MDSKMLCSMNYGFHDFDFHGHGRLTKTKNLLFVIYLANQLALYCLLKNEHIKIIIKLEPI